MLEVRTTRKQLEDALHNFAVDWNLGHAILRSRLIDAGVLFFDTEDPQQVLITFNVGMASYRNKEMAYALVYYLADPTTRSRPSSGVCHRGHTYTVRQRVREYLWKKVGVVFNEKGDLSYVKPAKYAWGSIAWRNGTPLSSAPSVSVETVDAPESVPSLPEPPKPEKAPDETPQEEVPQDETPSPLDSSDLAPQPSISLDYDALLLDIESRMERVVRRCLREYTLPDPPHTRDDKHMDLEELQAHVMVHLQEEDPNLFRKLGMPLRGDAPNSDANRWRHLSLGVLQALCMLDTAFYSTVCTPRKPGLLVERDKADFLIDVVRWWIDTAHTARMRSHTNSQGIGTSINMEDYKDRCTLLGLPSKASEAELRKNFPKWVAPKQK